MIGIMIIVNVLYSEVYSKTTEKPLEIATFFPSQFFVMNEQSKLFSLELVSLLTICLFVLPAIDLINNLLQVKMRKRYSVDKSLSHVYLQV